MPSNKKLLQAAAGNAGEALYVEDVFSTYLYDGTGASLPIVNGIDLDAEGGLVWTKSRTSAAEHKWYDSARGISFAIESNTTDANQTEPTGITSFNSNGYTYGTDGNTNSNGTIYASWTFRKAEKFFDIVTYTGNGVQGRAISHNLNGNVGCVIVKRTDASSGVGWAVWHNSSDNLALNLTSAENQAFNNDISAATSTTFTVSSYSDLNASGGSYVAYVFASDAGGFGDDEDENIIKCGSYTGNNGSTANVINVGFEPQYILIKGTDRACDWIIADVMRGATVAPSTSFLEANTSDAEVTSTSGYNLVHPTATGFSIPAGVSGNVNEFNEGYIYIAIRRPMKTPEAGTEVFDVDQASNSVAPKFRAPFPVDMAWYRLNVSGTEFGIVADRLRGEKELNFDTAFSEGGLFAGKFDYMNGWNNLTGANSASYSWMLKRATGFFDMVAYTGTGGTSTQAHNLGVVPELMIFKRRNSSGSWNTYVASSVLASAGPTKFLELNDTASIATDNNFINGAPTSSLINTGSNTNQNGDTYIAYLFATLEGVSKLGSYTGTGNNLNVDCGFSAGARFILIKRTDAINPWYYWDSERGIVAGNDPYLLINSSAAEVTNTDYVDPLNAGFTVTSSASSTVNVSSGTYIFLAIA